MATDRRIINARSRARVAIRKLAASTGDFVIRHKLYFKAVTAIEALERLEWRLRVPSQYAHAPHEVTGLTR